MKQYQKILENITSSIISKDYDALSDSLDQAYNSCPRSAKYKAAVCFGYQHLAKHLNDPPKAIKAMDRARLMFPSDKELLEDELALFQECIESDGSNLSSDDLNLIDTIVSIIIASVPKSSRINTDRICDNFKSKTNQNYNTTNEAKVRPNTIRDTGAYLYFNLTDEIRNKISKELTPHIPELYKAAKKLGLFDELEKKMKKEKDK